MQPHVVPHHLGDRMLGPCGVDLMVEEPLCLERLDLSH